MLILTKEEHEFILAWGLEEVKSEYEQRNYIRILNAMQSGLSRIEELYGNTGISYDILRNNLWELIGKRKIYYDDEGRYLLNQS